MRMTRYALLFLFIFGPRSLRYILFCILYGYTFQRYLKNLYVYINITHSCIVVVAHFYSRFSLKRRKKKQPTLIIKVVHNRRRHNVYKPGLTRMYRCRQQANPIFMGCTQYNLTHRWNVQSPVRLANLGFRCELSSTQLVKSFLW